MSGPPDPAPSTPTPTRSRGFGAYLIVVAFMVLMLGIWAGFAGRVWGMYVAYAAFAILLVLSTLCERLGWRRVTRRHGSSRILGALRPRRRAGKEPAVVAMSHRERIRRRPPDVLEQAGSLLLGVILVVVLLGGVVWVLAFLVNRPTA